MAATVQRHFKLHLKDKQISPSLAHFEEYQQRIRHLTNDDRTLDKIEQKVRRNQDRGVLKTELRQHTVSQKDSSIIALESMFGGKMS